MGVVLIRGGRVIDPASQTDRVTNVRVEDHRIASLNAEVLGDEDEIIEADGLIVAPGLVDLHAEFCEPGREEDETIHSGCLAAVQGGFTSVACLASTDPPIDTQAQVEFVIDQSRHAGGARLWPIACVSKGRHGKELAEMGVLASAGAVAFSDAPAPIWNPELMRRALEYALMLDRPILNHPEAQELTAGGVMHEGLTSMVLGLAGMTSAAEDVMTGRDIRLAEATGGRAHLLHLSSAGSISLVRRAKKRGTRVTCDAAPHHFTLTDETLRSFDSNLKTNPPIRSQEDVDAVIRGLVDGTIDCISSDHSPYAVQKKMQELDLAPFGISGLETALGLVVTKLIEPGHLDWMNALEKMTINPARVLGIEAGTIQPGSNADITLIDYQTNWTVDPSEFYSQGKNTPFAGWNLRGHAHTVLVDGKVAYRWRAGVGV